MDLFCYLLYDLGCWHVLFLSLFFVGFRVIMLDMCLFVEIYVSKIFVMGWLQMLQNSLEQCNMSLLIVWVEIMQISSLGSKLQNLCFCLCFYFCSWVIITKNNNNNNNKAFEFWYLILLWFFYNWSCLQQFLGFKVTLFSWVFLVLYSALAYRFVLTISHGRFCLTLWDLLDESIVVLGLWRYVVRRSFFFFLLTAAVTLDLYMIISPHSPNDIMPAICTG